MATLAAVSNVGPFGRLWKKYEQQLQKRPLITQMTTSAVLWGAGDVLAQQMEKRHPLDCRRLALTSAFGGAVVGPAGHLWYSSLDALCARFATLGSAKFLVTKVLADNLLYNPVYIAAFFAFGCAFIDRMGVDQFKQKMKGEFVPTMLAEAAVWPPYMAVVFARVPVAHQLLAVNAMTLLDVAFLSWVRDHGDVLESVQTAWQQRQQRPAQRIQMMHSLPVAQKVSGRKRR